VEAFLKWVDTAVLVQEAVAWPAQALQILERLVVDVGVGEMVNVINQEMMTSLADAAASFLDRERSTWVVKERIVDHSTR